jgi:hypothetical protein
MRDSWLFFFPFVLIWLTFRPLVRITASIILNWWRLQWVLKLLVRSLFELWRKKRMVEEKKSGCLKDLRRECWAPQVLILDHVDFGGFWLTAGGIQPWKESLLEFPWSHELRSRSSFTMRQCRIPFIWIFFEKSQTWKWFFSSSSSSSLFIILFIWEISDLKFQKF